MQDAAIRIEALSKTYEGGKRALREVSFDVPRGQIFGLLGPNGAGKSTLINILAGLVVKTSGKVTIWGFDIDAHPRNAKRSIGVVPQEIIFDPFFTPRETLEIQAGLYGIPKPDRKSDELLAAMHLTDKAHAYSRTLSGGMKRRLLVAKAMVHSPPILVLDEPTAGVDVELRQSLWSFIRKLNRDGHTIILTTHYLEEAEALCGRIAMMKAGRIVALDTTQHLLSRFAGLTVRVSSDRLPAEWLPRLHQREGRVHYLGLESYAELEQLLSAFRQAGIAIDELALAETDLEQVFLRIMAGSEASDEIAPGVALPET